MAVAQINSIPSASMVVTAVNSASFRPPNETLTLSTAFPTTVALNDTTQMHVRILNFLVSLVMGVTIDQDAGGSARNRFYTGSRLLLPITRWSGVPIDMINFVVASFVSIPLALTMRYGLSPSRIHPLLRAIAEILLGTGVVIFCFGVQIRVLLLQSTVAYVILLLCRRDRLITPLAVTIWSLFYLTLVHQCRLYYDYEGYTLDISGAIMLQTQRLSSLAFNLYDGTRIAKASASNGTCGTSDAEDYNVNDKDDAMRVIVEASEPEFMPSSREYAVEKMPGPVEFAAYCMYFHGVCVGPFVFFKDYQKYLLGYENKRLPPFPTCRFFYLVFCLAAYGLTYAALFNRIPVNFTTHKAFQELSLFGQMSYMFASFFVARLKYYFGWSLAELLGICAGNGYTGIDPETRSTLWLNVRNFDFFQVETAPNLKLLIDGWNIGTVKWLREVVYFRSPAQFRTLLVFLISAFWHGLYPGYYLMFLSFALFTYTSRTWRRNVRPLVLAVESPVLHRLYDLFTMLLTHFVMEYAQAPFHLLGFFPSINLWMKFLFLPHIVGAVIIFTLPRAIRCLKSIATAQLLRRQFWRKSHNAITDNEEHHDENMTTDNCEE